MSIKKVWEYLPNIDFSVKDNWQSLGNNRFAAMLTRILIVRIDEGESKYGPVLEAYNIGPDDEITLTKKHESVLSRVDSISDAVRFITKTRLCDNITSKISSELLVKSPGFSGKIQSEALKRSEYEISRHVESALVDITSHTIQEMESSEYTIKLKGNKNFRDAQLRRRYWQKRWNVYLHSFQYLELNYRKTWPWKQIRETIKRTQSGVLGYPLVSLKYYEPQPDKNVCYGEVVNEIIDPELVWTEALNDLMPRSIPPIEDSLEDFAKIAFPETKEEFRVAKRLIAKRKVAKKKVSKKKAASKKKTTTGKTTNRKVTSRKKITTVKTTKKKTVARKKTTTGKSTDKKTVSKKRVSSGKKSAKKSSVRRKR